MKTFNPHQDFSNPSEKTQHDKFEALVDNMLELSKLYCEVKMERDNELYERQIKVVDAQIERLVYDLYGLTDDEIGIVEDE
ncbi:MAG: hypothetical protein HF976_04895 [ANME-2 cluster archaeon]|nr:hypothetical protein [ANME-2 cluster archaeon]MBC2700743.1 hypothetical protein [ANME-2 cluster archaeon]MBC2709043.1 hypothetical protein [ANME-2 cluster archaeon]MBC2747302.1 hypothetical protein [ANME-2 cluster archaeon]